MLVLVLLEDESLAVLEDVSDFSDLFDDSPSLDEDELDRPLAEAEDDERESVMYQPLPLKTMPTG